jgi:ubiquitin carboxyl-terminal hydrolase 10
LEALHEECVTVLKSLPQATDGVGFAAQSTESTTSMDGGWLEVGPKQKAAITRSSGILVSDSPITKIFGGKLRSELRVPGLKNSVTLEPYRPLQLDIGASNIHNIVDALKGLTKSETLHGDFNSPRGPGTTATKQVFIETLPPVLILHLKRFQYDNTGGVQKIWKKVGYPLELTIPKESFPPQKRAALAMSGLPKYRLTAVVYHHGKNASGGHYTVDVRRQDGTEWIRFDDTVIKRLRAEDVAEAAAEEDPRVLAKALEKHKRDASLGVQNPYDSIDNEGEAPEDDDKGWNKVNGSTKDSSSSNRKWAAVVNGSSPPATTGKGTPKRESVKDKVAYILFYRKME